ncbi:Putative deoxyribose-phosphate aldolase [Ooceraea biroi]|uniref:deoxyribose-phosphate aldolase n=1 Tax=Ooceraea biroi TaxID=2015173 RepID=A0A026WSZ3_OOCBI|nr:Putative deoxyribose-phosphate aldolase [Ooceraea biroi]
MNNSHVIRSKHGTFYQYDPAWLETHVNEPAISNEVREIQHLASAITGNSRIVWLLKAISFIDLTSLNGNDTSTVIERLCKKAAQPVPKVPFKWEKPIYTAAVCVYPSRVMDAVNTLKSINKTDIIKVASVAAGFPSGQYPLQSRLEEVRCAIDYGAQEIDIVIDRSLVLDGKWEQLYDELVAIRQVCDEKKKICLKTILSTGELGNLTNVYKAAMIAMMAGADFIKTSTGKEAVNATLPVGIVMCQAIKEFARLTKKEIGFKPAGGIKTAQDALEWMTLMKKKLGIDWLINTRFRIGASSLLDDVAREIEAHKCEELDSKELS